MMHSPPGHVRVASRAVAATERNRAIEALRDLIPMCPDCAERRDAIALLRALDDVSRMDRRVEELKRLVEAAGRVS